MDIEKQVCSLEQAKRLAELGIIQTHKTFAWVQDESPFYSKNDVPDFFVAYADGYDWTEYPGYGDYKVIVAAYTVAELGVMLGDFISEVNRWDESKTEAWHRAEILIDHLTEKPQHTAVRLKMVNERLAS